MSTLDNYNRWLNSSRVDEATKEVLRKMNQQEIDDAFFKDVEFGTAGMRGTMGVGPNRMNFLTVRRTTLGLAKYIVKNKAEKKGVVITHDCRNNSKEYAHYVASVLTEFNIKVYMFIYIHNYY